MSDILGIFDSGVGGLTVVEKLHRQHPGLPILYFGDTKHTPYGEKTPHQLLELTAPIVQFLQNRGATTIVAACATASVTVLSELQQRSTIRLIGVTEALAQASVNASPRGRIALLATTATVKSGLLAAEIRRLTPGAQLYMVPCPDFVPLLEEWCNRHNSVDRIVQRCLQPLDGCDCDTVVLGCTHYPLLRDRIRSYLPAHISLVDIADVTASLIEQLLPMGDASDPSPPRLYVSADRRRFITTISELFPKYNWQVEEIELPVIASYDRESDQRWREPQRQIAGKA